MTSTAFSRLPWGATAEANNATLMVSRSFCGPSWSVRSRPAEMLRRHRTRSTMIALRARRRREPFRAASLKFGRIFAAQAPCIRWVSCQL